MIKIFDLKTEYIKNPLAIENLKPRFSYKIYSDKCFFQKSYRIIVASSKELLTNNFGDMWDSGEVYSDKIIGIEYQGKPLQARQKLFWKVIVGNVASEEEATFEMGLFDKNLWWGRWIGMPMNFHGNSLLLRTKLTVPSNKKITKARAYIAGLGCHEAFLNGKQVGEEKLNPSVSVYSKKVYYCTYPLDLKQGDNVFGVELGYGWYGSRMLMGQIFIDYSDGTFEHICTESGERWWLSSGAMETNSIYGGETFNANNYNRKWCTTEFTPAWDNGWMYSVGVDSPSGKLTSQTMEGMKFVETYYPVSENKFSDNNIVYDIGQNISGVASIKVKGEKNTKVILRYGERLTENGHINQLNLRTAKCEDVYILSGEEENYTPKFTYHGFQYVEVLIEGKAEIIKLCGKHLRNAVDKIGDFECSDPTINRLHKMAQMTESNNLQGVMTDCPQRDERFGWLNDLTSRIYQCVNNFNYARFLPKFVGDITDAQADNGAISDTVPHFVGGRPAEPASGYIILGLFDYMHYGDKKILEDNFSGFVKWLDFLSTKLVDGVLDFGIYGDWVPAAPYTKEGGECPFSAMTKPEYVAAAYYVWYSQMMTYISEILNKKKEYNFYKTKSKTLLKAFNEKYFNKEICCYGSGNQSDNAIAITIKANNSKVLKKLAKFVNQDIIKEKYHTTCGNQGYRHMLYNLAEYGYIDTLIKLLKNKEYPGWGYMLEKGATTVWERWEDNMCNLMHSYNHPMFASYDGMFYNCLVGLSIDNSSCGSNKFVISPKIPKLINYAKASLETISGKVECEWKKENNKVSLKAVIPANTYVTFKLSGIIISVNDKSDYISKEENKYQILEQGNGIFNIEYLL